MTQTLLAGALVFGAAAYLVRRALAAVRAARRGPACGSGCGCDS